MFEEAGKMALVEAGDLCYIHERLIGRENEIASVPDSKFADVFGRCAAVLTSESTNEMNRMYGHGFG